MIELKFVKELPVRLINQEKKVLILNGGDIYTDKDGNRYAYLSFKNLWRKPALSLYLIVKEYDVNGTLIRENKHCCPSIYVSKESYVIEKPIKITRDCEGLDVYIAYVELLNAYFYEDKVVRSNPKCLEEIAPEIYCSVPKHLNYVPFVERFDKQPSVKEELVLNEQSGNVQVEKNSNVQTDQYPEQSYYHQEEYSVPGFTVKKGLKFNPSALFALGGAIISVVVVLLVILLLIK